MTKYIIPRKLPFFLYLLLAVSSALVGVLFAFVYSSIIDYASTEDGHWLLFSAGILLFITATIAIETAFAVYKEHYLKLCTEKLRNDLFSAVIRQDILSFEQKTPAEYVNALTVKMDLYERSYLSPILDLPLLIATLVFALSATIMVNPILLLFLIGFGLLMFFVMKKVGGGIEGAAQEHVQSTDAYAKRAECCDDKMNRILTLSCLDKTVGNLQNGLDTPINTTAKNLSAGEIERIGIARVFYQDYQIYLLDELTANLDQKTAAVVEQQILALEHATILNITHDLGEHLRGYDEVFIMKDGKIVDRGTYEDIIKRNALSNMY